MKISKKLRADAALILQVVASNYYDGTTNTYAAECEIKGTYYGHGYTPAGDLARCALRSVPYRFQGQLAYAEAECMLLEGWEP